MTCKLTCVDDGDITLTCKNCPCKSCKAICKADCSKEKKK